MGQVIEHEAPEQGAEETPKALAVTGPAAIALGAMQVSTGQELVDVASSMATVLAKVIAERGLSTKIQGRDYVGVEGWTTLSTMMGVLPYEAGVEYDAETGAYCATVELRRQSDGHVLVRASSECGHEDDRPWHTRPRYARRSMAVTRATGKACRLAFSWVMTLAGYQTTPAEEMPRRERQQKAPSLDLAPEEMCALYGGRIERSATITELQKHYSTGYVAARTAQSRESMDYLEAVYRARKAVIEEGQGADVEQAESNAEWLAEHEAAGVDILPALKGRDSYR